MSRCANCAAEVRPGVDECPECGKPVYVKDRQRQAPDDRARRDAEKLRTADYERKRYNLEPRLETESVDVYYARIDREKTPAILTEHKRLQDRLQGNPTNQLELPATPREPGSDDEPEVSHEQAA